MNVSIVTPEKTLFKDAAAHRVTLSTEDGEITVLEDHIPLVTFLKPGEVVIEDDKGVVPMAISGGFVEVANNSVKILADTAEKVEELDIDRAEEARKRAEQLLKNKHQSSEDFAFLSAKIEKEMARVRIGRKYRKLPPIQ